VPLSRQPLAKMQTPFRRSSEAAFWSTGAAQKKTEGFMQNAFVPLLSEDLANSPFTVLQLMAQI
jgi:hypothetical protein